jgi:pyruvate formate lyase activating enzyme
MLNGDNECVYFDIQGFSVHDGPGARSLVFLKGCPLRCYWCCNPEGQETYCQVMYRRSNCLKCYRCVNNCPKGAISVESIGDYVTIDRKKCNDCKDQDCVEGCYNGALGRAGKIITLNQLMIKIERDRRFWGAGGGITLGGGEMMHQYKFAARLLEECHASSIHTSIETSGYAPWSHYETVLMNVDWVFVDIKHMDPFIHKKGTGVSNKLILENIERMACNRNYRLIVRVPIIPAYNDGDKNIMVTAQFLRKIGIHEVNILPFHRLGTSKFEQLDREYACKDMQSPSQETMEHIENIFKSNDVACYIGSDTPF